jgi:hypothetical protein
MEWPPWSPGVVLTGGNVTGVNLIFGEIGGGLVCMPHAELVFDRLLNRQVTGFLPLMARHAAANGGGRGTGIQHSPGVTGLE